MGKKKQDAITNTVTAPDESSKSRAISREEAVARLKTDFDRFYFVTGQMDLDLYEEDCTFSDPFVAFQGRQRFKVHETDADGRRVSEPRFSSLSDTITIVSASAHGMLHSLLGGVSE